MLESKPSQEYIDHHNKKNDGHEHMMKQVYSNQKTTKITRSGYCKICWCGMETTIKTHKIIPIKDGKVTTIIN